MTHAIKSPTATREPVLAIGQSMAEQAGRTVVTLQRVTVAAWTVTVYTGSHRVEDQCSSFADEVAAALTASAYLQLARAEQIQAEATNPAAPLAQGEIRTHSAGDVTVTIAERPTGGFLVQLRKGAELVREACRFHANDTPALAHFAALVAAHPTA